MSTDPNARLIEPQLQDAVLRAAVDEFDEDLRQAFGFPATAAEEWDPFEGLEFTEPYDAVRDDLLLGGEPPADPTGIDCAERYEGVSE